MCVLCGYGLSPYDWANPVTPDEQSGLDSPAHRTARRAQLARAKICDAILAGYGVRVRTPTAREYLLSDGKGRHRIVHTLSDVWSEASALAQSSLDPLDPELLARLGDG